MPMIDRRYNDRKRKIAWFRKLPIIFWFILVGCPALCWLLYQMGFRIEAVK